MRALATIKTRARGITLLVSLIMMILVMLLGASAAQLSLQGEKAARCERDREVALQAAKIRWLG